VAPGSAQALTHEAEHRLSDRNSPPVGHPNQPVRKDTHPRTILRANVAAGGDNGNILPSPLLSRRTLVDHSLNALSVALARARDAGRPILDLTVSNPTASGIDYDTRSILEALALPGALVYEPSPRGIAEARTAVAGYLSAGGPAVDPARIVLTASTSEAYAFLFKLLVDPGGEVLVPRPSYPLLEHLARVEAVRCVPYRLAYDGSWYLDFSSVESAMSSRTRAIVVVQPNNPTGSYLTARELEQLGSLGLPIISDEVFSSYPLHNGESSIPRYPATRAPLTFALGGLSKLAALPQVKLAWITVGGEGAIVSEALERLELIADTFLSVGTPVQLGTSALLKTRARAEQSIRERTRGNLELIRRVVVGSAVSVLDVQAGWYATMRLPRTQTEEAWTVGFVEKDGVYVHPGHFFDFEEEAYVVVSVLTPEAVFEEGVTRIVQRVSEWT
jgi:alanine-synthesizing transaminase